MPDEEYKYPDVTVKGTVRELLMIAKDIKDLLLPPERKKK